jgi:hypothetical protein
VHPWDTAMDIAKKILGRLHRNVGSVLASDPEHFHGHYAGFLQSLHETVEVTGLNTAQPANNTQGRAAPSVVGLGSLIDKKNNDARQGVIQSLINTLSPGGLYGGNSHDAITCRNVVLAACVEDCKNKVKHPLASTICVWVSPGRCASPSAAASFFRCASCCHGASAWGACTPHATDQVVATTVALDFELKAVSHERASEKKPLVLDINRTAGHELQEATKKQSGTL